MHNEIPRRRVVGAHELLRPAFFGLVALVFSDPLVAAESIRAVRVWPAPEYTRVTLESGEPLKHSLLLLKNPERLVLDLTDVDLSSVQQGLEGKVAPTDPHIANLRVGQFKPAVVRVVLELKAEAKPQIFTLPPIGFYGHRLVLDIHPIEPLDPLLTLLPKADSENGRPLGKSQEGASQEERAADPSGKLRKPARERPAPAVNRLVTIVIDPGHGGEDPGARGRRGTHEKKVTLIIARKLKALIDAEPQMRAIRDHLMTLRGGPSPRRPTPAQSTN